VLRLFQEAAQKFGLPSRIRTDHGGENILIRDFMEEERGQGRGSCIQGRSVHNQRIERLWRDVWTGAVAPYHALLHSLEQEAVLQMDNPDHLWAVHFVFLPKVCRALQQFALQWNHHGLRTMLHMPPMQIFARDSLAQCNTTLTAMEGLFRQPLPTYEISPAAPLSRHPCPVSEEQLARLTVDPSLDDGQLGRQHFTHVLEFIADQ
jgi:hypothetical protein